MEQVFAPLPAGTNALPSVLTGGLAALILCGDVEEGLARVPEVEVGIIDTVVKRPGWVAPFLLRSDGRSELHVKLFDVDGSRIRNRSGAFGRTVISPRRFICRVSLACTKDGYFLEPEGLSRLHITRELVR